uniref:Uncharacterized protein n=1 Tax=viral metagenome TaxID=1070528 RepID=A0A6M3LC15_9ZZZZ
MNDYNIFLFDVVERLWGMSYPIPQWVAWGLFGLGWFIAFVMTYHELRIQKANLETQADNKVKRKEIRESLGKFLEQGQSLQGKCFSQGESPEGECQSWADEVETFLENKLDSSYISRFRSSAGVPLTAMVDTTRHPNLWKAIHTRNFQLSKFLEEL